MSTMSSRSPLLDVEGMAPTLERVDEALRRSVVTDDQQLTELASHLIVAGGKRLRPAMVVAAGDLVAGKAVSGDLVMGGVSVELVHLGSLYHDDVMDEAATRHHVDSVNARWGNLRAILAGDYLLAKASEIAASLGTEIAGLLAATIARLCEGQVRELQLLFDTTRDVDQWTAAVAGKTAALYATSCRIGALVAGRPREEVEALTAFGTAYGMAFQTVDDILDVVATDEQLGKPSGKDLADGVYTLPTILALGSVEGGELHTVLGRPLEGPEVEAAKLLVKRSGAVDQSVEVARGYAEEAVTALQGVPSSPGVEGLRAAAIGLIATVDQG